jgi:hypothetical protein
MALGDITSSATAYETMALLETALEAENTGGATAGADTTTFQIVPVGMAGFWLVKIVRAAA